MAHGDPSIMEIRTGVFLGFDSQPAWLLREPEASETAGLNTGDKARQHRSRDIT